jgi:RNA polymerase sigma-70 factor (ECF subfamily)
MMDSVVQLESHRPALTGHCYRMLGSVVDADDAVQETMVRAWRSLDRFEGRSSLRSWLYRIATHVCLDTLADDRKRARPMEEGPEGTVRDTLEQKSRRHWLEPIADAHAIPPDADPAEQLTLRQSIRLAFVAALQHLPPKQRAVLILTEVLGWSVAEVAECLELSSAAVNSALQRARATLASRNLGENPATPLTGEQTRLLEQYLEAFHRYDVDALTALLRDDATLSMPPYSLWLRGPQTIAKWLGGRGSECRGSRLIPTAANGSPAFGQFRPAPGGGHRAFALIVLELEGTAIGSWNSFLDVATLFPHFGLPLELPAQLLPVASQARPRGERVY